MAAYSQSKQQPLFGMSFTARLSMSDHISIIQSEFINVYDMIKIYNNDTNLVQ